MKTLKIITILSFVVITSSQMTEARSLLDNNNSTGSSLLGNGQSSTGQSLLNQQDNYNTNINNIYNQNGSQMNCYTNSFGQTVCN